MNIKSVLQQMTLAQKSLFKMLVFSSTNIQRRIFFHSSCFPHSHYYPPDKLNPCSKTYQTSFIKATSNFQSTYFFLATYHLKRFLRLIVRVEKWTWGLVVCHYKTVTSTFWYKQRGATAPQISWNSFPICCSIS